MMIVSVFVETAVKQYGVSGNKSTREKKYSYPVNRPCRLIGL
jgi:hypothetical protein